MIFTPALQPATLIKRYKRFLADVILADGDEVTIHCANTGAMTGCGSEGDTIWYSTSANPKRKYPYSWELTETSQGHMIGINSARANHLAREGIEAGIIPQLSGYAELQSEVKYGNENSRIDILLSDKDKGKCYIEVKSVSLLENDCGYFPDAKTARGQKHIRELITVRQQGHRAVLLFIAQHSGITQVKPAKHIDKDYSELIKQAIHEGVEVLAYTTTIDPDRIELIGQISFKSD